MLKLIAFVIAALAVARVWQIVSREKTQRESKMRYIAKRLEEIEQQETENQRSTDETE